MNKLMEMIRNFKDNCEGTPSMLVSFKFFGGNAIFSADLNSMEITDDSIEINTYNTTLNIKLTDEVKIVIEDYNKFVVKNVGVTGILDKRTEFLLQEA